MKQHCKFYPFLKAVHGNWHNAIFVSCTHSICPYGHPHPCEGYLLAADANGVPILMQAEYIRNLTGESVSREDCQGVIGIQAFEAAYSLYIEWHTASSRDCPLRQLCQPADMVPDDSTTDKDMLPP